MYENKIQIYEYTPEINEDGIITLKKKSNATVNMPYTPLALRNVHFM